MPPDELKIKINADDTTQSVFQKIIKRVTDLTRENQKLENRIDHVSKRLTEYRERLVSTERRLNTTRDRLTRLTTTVRDMGNTLKRVTKDFDNLESRQQKQASTIRQLQQANKRLEVELKKVQTQLDRNTKSTGGAGKAQEDYTDRVLTASTVFNDFAGALFQVGGLLQRIGTIGFEAVRELGRAALEIDRARESFIALADSVAVADNRIEELWELAQLPGVTFRGALQSAQLLEAVGVSAKDSTQLIIEFGNAIELSGRTQVDFRETLRQVSQGISRNKIQQEELNVIFERAPIIARAVKEAYGTIDPETITAHLKEAGETAEDFWRRIAHETLPGQARANINSLQNQVTNLQNAFEQLKQGLGVAIIPEIQSLTSATRSLLDRFNELTPATKRTVALAATGTTFFSQFAGSAFEVAANIGLTIFGLRQMRGSLTQVSRSTRQVTKAFKDLDPDEIDEVTKAVQSLEKSSVKFSDVRDKLASDYGITAKQFESILDIFGTAAFSAATTAAIAGKAGSALAGLGSIVLRFIPYVGGAVAVLTALGFIINHVTKETDEAGKENKKFEESLNRVNTAAGMTAELNERIKTLVRYRNLIRQGHREDLPTGIGTADELDTQIDALVERRNFYRDSDYAEFQRRFTEEIDAHTVRLEEIFAKEEAIFDQLASGVPTQISRRLEREQKELAKQVAAIEAEITQLDRIFLNIPEPTEAPERVSTFANYALHFVRLQDELSGTAEAISQATSVQGLQNAVETAKRLTDETADLERLQAHTREENRDREKRDAERFASELQQISINAANAKVDIDQRAAAQSVNIYRNALQAIRNEAASAVTLRQVQDTANAAISAIDQVVNAEQAAARERERLRDSTVQDAQALARELLNIELQGGRNRLEVYKSVASQTSTALSSVLSLVTDRGTLNRYEGEIDRLSQLAIDAVRDVEAEEIKQAQEREARRSVEARDEEALAEEITEIRRRANAKILEIEKATSKSAIEINKSELDERIKLFEDFESRRRAFTARSTADRIKLDVEAAKRIRDNAKRELDRVLNQETSSTDERIEALDRYQRAAEDYNDEYLYQHAQTTRSAVERDIESKRVQKALEDEIQQHREDINKRRLANEQKLQQSVIDTANQANVREFEREAAANQRDLDRKEKQRRDDERARRTRERDAERERNREINEERRALSQRLQDYTRFYNALRTLDVSSVQNALLGIARVTADYLANLATRLAADAAYAAQRTAIERGASLSAATAQGASAGLGALVGSPIAIGAIIASLGLSFLNSRRATRQESVATVGTRTFHDSAADFLAERAGRSAARMTPTQSRSNQMQNARDFTSSFVDGFEKEMRQRGMGAGGGSDDRPIVVQLQLQDKTIQEVWVRADTMTKQGRMPRGRRR